MTFKTFIPHGEAQHIRRMSSTGYVVPLRVEQKSLMCLSVWSRLFFFEYCFTSTETIKDYL